MRAGAFVATLVAGAVIGAAGTALFLSRAGSGGEPNPQPQTRHNPVMLMGGNPAACVAVKPDPVGGRKRDRVEWRFSDACGLEGTNVRIEFDNGSGPDNGTGKLEGRIAGGQVTLFVNIKEDLGPPNEGKHWVYQYHIIIKDNGVDRRLQDPKFEVDPM